MRSMLFSFLFSLVSATSAHAVNINLVQSANRFGLTGFRLAAKQYDDKNVIFSPISAHFLLNLLLNGAATQTAEEIGQTIGLPTASLAQSNQLTQQLLHDLNARPEGELKLVLANGLWTAPSLAAKAEFVTLAKERFDAEVAPLQSADQVNAWASGKTNGLITHILDRSDDIQMLLANATYFKAKWTSPFSPARAGEFYPHAVVPSGAAPSVPVQMMNGELTTRYFHSENEEAVELPYGPNRLASMIVVLPSATADFAAYREAISEAWWTRLSQNLSEQQPVFLAVTMPKVETHNSWVMNESLKSLGMRSAFTSSADFSKLSDSRLEVSVVKQDSAIRIDEGGTEAAAVTSVGLKSLAVRMPSVRFVANRPFFYFIRDNVSGVLLFAGQFMAPTN